MLLALDIGNSTIAAAVFEGASMRAHARASSTIQRTQDETWHVIEQFLYNANLSLQHIHSVGISSVVPFLTTLFESLTRERLIIEPLIISTSLDLGIKIHYDEPATLGSDRICSAIAAHAKYGGPLIVVDFGTATTFGVVAANGDFLGGAIGLGVKATAEALHRRTAQLPEIKLEVPPSVIATNTIAAMQAGTMFPAIDGLEGMVRRIKMELGTQAKVVATGGLSALMASLTPTIEVCEPFLVLEGIRLIAARGARR